MGASRLFRVGNLLYAGPHGTGLVGRGFGPLLGPASGCACPKRAVAAEPQRPGLAPYMAQESGFVSCAVPGCAFSKGAHFCTAGINFCTAGINFCTAGSNFCTMGSNFCTAISVLREAISLLWGAISVLWRSIRRACRGLVVVGLSRACRRT